MLIRSLGSAAVTRPGTVSRVEVLGGQGSARWQQTADGLRVDLSGIGPAAEYATVLRVHLG